MSRRKQKLRLHKENPHCHWCGVLTVLEMPASGELSEYAATIDHLDDRMTPQRYAVPPDGSVGQRVVLACHRCNDQRNRERMAEVGKAARTAYQRKLARTGARVMAMRAALAKMTAAE